MGPRFPLALLPLAAVLIGAQGQSAVESGLDDELRKTLVSRHNYFRTKLGVPGMLKLHWNTKLEDEAAKSVSQCNFLHQENPLWGENLYRTQFDRPKLSIVHNGMNSWYLEKAFDGISSCCDASTNTTLCCNYQQMVWIQSKDIGCAIKKCDLLTSPSVNYLNEWFMACYYSPRYQKPALGPSLKELSPKVNEVF